MGKLPHYIDYMPVLQFVDTFNRLLSKNHSCHLLYSSYTIYKSPCNTIEHLWYRRREIFPISLTTMIISIITLSNKSSLCQMLRHDLFIHKSMYPFFHIPCHFEHYPNSCIPNGCMYFQSVQFERFIYIYME